jgi:hypothetical protein
VRGIGGFRPARTWREAPRAKRALRKNFEISMPFCLFPDRSLALAAWGALRAKVFAASSALRAHAGAPVAVAVAPASSSSRRASRAAFMVTPVTMSQLFLPVGWPASSITAHRHRQSKYTIQQYTIHYYTTAHNDVSPLRLRPRGAGQPSAISRPLLGIQSPRLAGLTASHGDARPAPPCHRARIVPRQLLLSASPTHHHPDRRSRSPQHGPTSNTCPLRNVPSSHPPAPLT